MEKLTKNKPFYWLRSVFLLLQVSNSRGRASRYYPYFCQLASQMDEMMTDDEDEEDEIPVDTWDRPDMTDE